MDGIPENIRIYMQEIADKMRQGRAAVMIGSGFSKNAVKCRSTNKAFFDWNQLGDILYRKLYGKYPKDEINPNYYQDVLKLAGGVQQCFGRTTLDKLLLDNLPDEEYEPSELHEMLLQLGWTDIFTTNYDTLLERTRVKVYNRRYQVVLNKDDLVYSKCPRIIKLHGSFPSTRPFILTEEDYRKYPKESAIFVNTVQQSLIENIMCMIGFSGDDPNFLNWIGWIRDNLGNDVASKIYLIGVFDLKETDLRLYQSRNIVLINMQECEGVGKGNHQAGLKLFFQKLREFQVSKQEIEGYDNKEHEICALLNILKWKSEKGEKEKSEIFLKGLLNISKTWEKERKSYRESNILPYQKREIIEKSVFLSSELVKYLTFEEENIDITGTFLYEFDWRRNKCFLPLDPEIVSTYQNYLQQKTGGFSKTDNILCISLMRFLREHGKFEEWQIWDEKLIRNIKKEQY